MNGGIFPNPDGRGGTTLATADVFSPGFYAKDRIVMSGISYQFYAKKVTGISLVDPGTNNATSEWALIGAPARKSYQEFSTTMIGGGPFSVAVTISAITSKYIIHPLGARPTAGSVYTFETDLTIKYTNPTTITLERGSGSVDVVVQWAVEDFWL